MKYAALAAVLLCAAAHAQAATCTVSAVSLAFGNYNTFKIGHTDTTGNIAVTCTGKPGEVVAYGIALSAGAGAFQTRRMTNASGFSLNYNIYTNASRTIVWGDGAGGSLVVNDAYTLAGPMSTRNYPVYGRTFSGQKIAVGIYTDAIVVTLNF